MTANHPNAILESQKLFSYSVNKPCLLLRHHRVYAEYP